MSENNKSVAEYYTYTTGFYRIFWHGSTGALHYGFADETTSSLADELLNTNKFLAQKAGIRKGDRILDAGCGVGGSSIWLRENFDVTVARITLSEKQMRKARETARKKNLENVSFAVKDFLLNGYSDESFDVVWAIESFCYAADKETFLKEAFRILKPGGRLIVADGFLHREPANEQERLMLQQFLEGLVLPNLAQTEQFSKAMNRVGFTVSYWDKTQSAFPSVNRLYNRCRVGHKIAKVTGALRLTPPLLTKNNLAGIAQYHMVNAGLAGYGVFLGTKPTS